MAFGTGRMINSFVVGTEGGSIYKSALSFTRRVGKHGVVTDADMKWSADAAAAIVKVGHK
jgi:hypothetical protein